MRIFADNFSDQFLHDIALGIQSLLTYFQKLGWKDLKL